MTWAWQFFGYVAPSGGGVWNEMSEDVQDALLIHLRRQRTLPQWQWKGMVKQLTGKQWRDLYENLLTIDGVQHRPFGFFGIEQQEYTIVTTATHKQTIYKPADVFKTAMTRRATIKLTGGCRREIELG